MSTEAEDLHRIISASGRDMLDAYRIQAQAGPVTDKVLEEIIFRAAHGVVQCLAPYAGEQRVALLPSVVRLLLASFLEEVAGAAGSPFEFLTAHREGILHEDTGPLTCKSRWSHHGESVAFFAPKFSSLGVPSLTA